MKNLTVLTETQPEQRENGAWTGWKFRLQKRVAHTSRRLSIASSQSDEAENVSSASHDESEAANTEGQLFVHVY
jgi:hypothetical protein